MESLTKDSQSTIEVGKRSELQTEIKHD